MPRKLLYLLVFAVLVTGCVDLASGTSGDPIHIDTQAPSGVPMDHRFNPSYTLPVSVKSTAADTTYHSWTKVGEGHVLSVVPAGGGEPFLIRRQPIKAS